MIKLLEKGSLSMFDLGAILGLIILIFFRTIQAWAWAIVAFILLSLFFANMLILVSFISKDIFLFESINTWYKTGKFTDPILPHYFDFMKSLIQYKEYTLWSLVYGTVVGFYEVFIQKENAESIKTRKFKWGVKEKKDSSKMTKKDMGVVKKFFYAYWVLCAYWMIVIPPLILPFIVIFIPYILCVFFAHTTIKHERI
jgi:hypothetical protein